jgi:hypothetical protein
MDDSKLTNEDIATGQRANNEKVARSEKPVWETPKLEDVSEQVMAQPYIRFT